jgi:amylosucrase
VAESQAARRQQATAALARLRPSLEAAAQRRLYPLDAVAFMARLDQHLLDIYEPLDALYGASHDTDAVFERLLGMALDTAAARPEPLRSLDRRREIDPGWYQRARNLGYVCYVDRFCGTLDQVPGTLDYLAELGVTYLHLMPLLKPRDGENDGGYAVQDYQAVDPRVGTMDDLEHVATALRDRGMSLCIDLVVNHTSKEHEWAQGWLAGDPQYADFYTAFRDRTLPDAYEATIAEVFPDRAPGSFTWFDEVDGGRGGWVWTTFWSYQWDLNYQNPNVFAAMLETIGKLANRGVEIFRMDAVPFMWKRMGTGCLNQPEVHTLVQALHALTKLSSPAVIFKAEAIVAPDDLVPYLGGHERYRPECELAYHNQLMVMLWSSLATQDARLATQSLRRLKQIPHQTSWVTYVRCHDDIGWAVSDHDAAAVGWNGFSHRRFLNDFFSGRFPGSYARGALFQENPATGDARISGSAAALCGLEAALERNDTWAVAQAVRRLVLLYAVTYGFGGIPLLYMGDELAQRNDQTYLDDPALSDDNRWLHRPFMDWDVAERRHDPATVEGTVFGWLQRLARARQQTLALRGGGDQSVIDIGDPRILAWRRRHPRSGSFIAVANVSEQDVWIDPSRLRHEARLESGGHLDVVIASDDLEGFGTPDRWWRLPGLGFAWLTEP